MTGFVRLWSLVALTCLGCGSPIDNGNTDVPGVESSGKADEHSAGQAIPQQYVAGQEIYTNECSLCHDHGEAGAPRLGNPLQWNKRIGQGEAVMVEHALNGFEGKWGEMPPQSTDLSKEQVEAAVKYMLYRFESAKEE